MGLLAEGRESLLVTLVNGPTRDQADYARQMGYVAGLEELGNAVEAIRKAAASRRKKLEAHAEAERTSEPEEVAA